MAKDFQSSQISTSQIIASRSLSTLPSIMVISSSNADGVGGITPPLGAGPDVFFFVSGSKSNDAYASFGGSVKVSGSLIVQEGLTGSLQVTAGGLPYLVAGTNITLSTASNGQITINSSGGGGGGAPTDAQYLVLSANGTLTDERVITVGTGLSSSDGGAGGSFLLAVDNSVVATISGSTFTGAVKFNQGLSGSLTKLTDGTSYLVASSSIEIVTASNGSVKISAKPAGTIYTVQYNDGTDFAADSNFFYQNDTLNIVDLYLQTPDGSSSATIESDKFGLDIELFDNPVAGSSLEFTGGGSPIAGIQRSGTDRYMHLDGSTRLKIGTPSAWEMELYYDSGTSTGYLTNGTGILDISSPGGIDVTGPAIFNQGLSGSLTHLEDGSSYLIAGTNVTITTGSSGAVTINSSGGGGGTPASPNDSIQFNNAGSFGGSSSLKWIDGSSNLFLTGSLVVTGSLNITGSILPGSDSTYDLGSPSKRWANVYTGDLHLRNERGHWTIVEEADFLCVVNNLTGKKYKMMLEPLPE